ncbi:MAG: thioredoxin domain-containing protein [Myxococcota bacterium]
MPQRIEITAASFETLVARNPGATVLEVGAPRCGPCRALLAVLDALVVEVGDAVRITSTNADAEPDLAARLGVRSLPTLIVFRDGVEVERRVGFGGARPVRDLVTTLARDAAPSAPCPALPVPRP